MDVTTLRERLSRLGLDNRGHKRNLIKQLKSVIGEGADTLKEVVKEAKERKDEGKEVGETDAVEGKEVRETDAVDGKEAVEGKKKKL